MCEIANRIRTRRLALGLTLEEVAQAVGVGRSTVRKWETGMIKNMGRDKIAKLAAVLQMNPVDLVPMTLGDDEEEGFYVAIPKEEYDDMQRLEALHQNPKLRMLFDIQKNMSESDLSAVLGVVNAIAKERGDDD